MKQPKIQFLILISTLLLSACMTSANTGSATKTSSGGVSPSLNVVVGQITSNAQQGGSTESALVPETNPIGDIPDNQVFIRYISPTGGYSLEVPEGWARTEQGANVHFVDKFDGVSVSLSINSSAPSVDSITENQAITLAQSERAFMLGAVNKVNLPAGSIVQIKATANSDPDPVTGKQVRLEEEFYFFYQNGNLATLKLWAPQGADNVDQWKRISESFQWQ
jgi:hypothetical protein